MKIIPGICSLMSGLISQLCLVYCEMEIIENAWFEGYGELLVSSHLLQRAGQHFLSVSELLSSSVKTVVSAKHTFSGVKKKKYAAKAPAQTHCSPSFAGLRSWSEICVLYACLIVESFDDMMAHSLILVVIQVSLQASEIPTMITVFLTHGNTIQNMFAWVVVFPWLLLSVQCCFFFLKYQMHESTDWFLGSLSRFLFPTGSALHCCSYNLHITIRVMMDLSFMVTTVAVAIMEFLWYPIVRMYISEVKVFCPEVTDRYVQQR